MRSRHCKRVETVMQMQPLRKREGDGVFYREPGNLPIGTVREKKFSRSRGLDCTMTSAEKLYHQSFYQTVKGFFAYLKKEGTNENADQSDDKLL